METAVTQLEDCNGNQLPQVHMVFCLVFFFWVCMCILGGSFIFLGPGSILGYCLGGSFIWLGSGSIFVTTENPYFGP